MAPDKAQLDTIELYLGTIVSKDKTAQMIEQVKQVDDQKAQEIVLLFEQRANPRLADVERILKKKQKI
ncbi:hypothetical protein K8R43_00820 [archaeon]|nr:hypothetical protein [archaeon]